MRYFLYTILLFLFCQSSTYSQTVISPERFRFADIAEGSLLYTDFQIQNTSKKTDYVLRADASRQIQILYSAKRIEAGSFVKMRVHYTPQSKGAFDEKIQVFVSSNREPILIRISGNALYVPENNDIACPSFDTEPTEIQSFKATVIVQDSITGLPVKSATLQLIAGNDLSYSSTTNAMGKAEFEFQPGRYLIAVEAENYNYSESVHYFNKHQPLAVIVLGKIDNLISQNATELPADNLSQVDSESSFTEQALQDSKDLKNSKSDELPTEIYSSNNVVFLIDISTSMRKFERLDLLKQAMINLLEPLRSIDRLAIITYASNAEILMESTPADNHAEIEALIQSLEAEGQTAGGKGLKKAYQVAAKNFIEGGNNQIIIATDGAFNENPDNKIILNLANKNAKKGIILSVVGIKNPQWTISGLKKLAGHGKGSYIVIESWEDDSGKLLDEIKLRSQK